MMAELKWWQTSVIYEITLPSFQDSNEDGWGDIPGLVRRLDYIRDLGVDAIWLTPINESPLYDLGYDVSCYTAIEPRFGTFKELDRLLEAAHARGLRVVLDFVPNHTSTDHAWFTESRASRDNLRHDWYIWNDGRPGNRPPNNWVNRFGRSAWTWDEPRGQYYFGSFSERQPDLNWRNHEVRRAVYDAMRFWLDRGVDGLRIDALSHLVKDERLRDNPPNLGFDDSSQPSNKMALIYHQNQPELLGVIRELRSVIDEYGDRVFIGEVYQTPEQITAYQNAGAQLLLSTSMLQTDFEALHLRTIVDLVEARTAVGAWPARSSGNHDISRLANRVGECNLRLAVLLQMTVRGTPTVYYGEELGLMNVSVPHEQMRDPSGLDDPKFSRDGFRAPMPWDGSKHGGFSPVEPWLPQDQATLARNVEAQLADPGSILNFYRNTIHFRRSQTMLQSGAYFPMDTPGPLFAFIRGDRAQGLLVVLNIGDAECSFELKDHFSDATCARVLFSTIFREDTQCTQSIALRPREGIVAQLREL